MTRAVLLTAASVAFAVLLSALSIPAALAAEGDHKVTFWKEGDPGERLLISGRVLDSQGKPIAGAHISVRQADGGGSYSERYSGELVSAQDGKYQLRTALPGQYSSAKHIHINVVHDSYRPLYTEILFKGDPNAEPSGRPNEVLLEEAHHNGKVVFVGTFDLVLQR